MSAERIDELRAGDTIPTPGGDSFEVAEPHWLDKKKVYRAREIFNDHFASVNFSHLCGLVLSFYFTKNIVTLRSTGWSETTKMLFQRYMATVRHIQSWYEGDVWDINDKGRKSLFAVRGMHARAASKMAARQDGVVYVSQWDMALTQWAFIGPMLLFPTRVGLHSLTDDDFDALVHFWRGIGYLLGVEDEYNLCNGTYGEVHNACRTVLHEEYKPRVRIAHPSSASMAESVVVAFRKFNGLFTWGFLSNYVHELIDEPCPVALGFFDWISFEIHRFMMGIACKYSVPRSFINESVRWLLNKADVKVKSYTKDINLIGASSVRMAAA